MKTIILTLLAILLTWAITFVIFVFLSVVFVNADYHLTSETRELDAQWEAGLFYVLAAEVIVYVLIATLHSLIRQNKAKKLPLTAV
jgi:hypothetical protein